MNFKPLIILLILIAPSLSANVTFTESSCSNNITLQQVTKIEVDNITNITTEYNNFNCIHGCDTNTGACNNPDNDFSFLGLVILGFLGAGGAIFLVANSLNVSDELSPTFNFFNGTSKFVLILLTLFSVYASLMIVVLYVQDFQGILGAFGDIALRYSQGLFAILFVLFMYGFIMFIIQMMDTSKQRKQKREEEGLY